MLQLNLVDVLHYSQYTEIMNKQVQNHPICMQEVTWQVPDVTYNNIPIWFHNYSAWNWLLLAKSGPFTQLQLLQLLFEW